MVASRRSIPASIAERPEPGADEFVYRAFFELSTCRRYDAGPIPWTEARLWASSHKMDADEFAELLVILRELDLVYLEHLGKVREARHKALEARK